MKELWVQLSCGKDKEGGRHAIFLTYKICYANIGEIHGTSAKGQSMIEERAIDEAPKNGPVSF